MNKLFFFDIDGTLIDCPHELYKPSKISIDSLNKLKQEGNYVFLATGRCMCFIVDEVMEYPFDGYVTCNGGSVIFNNTTVFKKVISKEAIKRTHEVCKKYNWLYYFESNDHIYVLNKNDSKHITFRDNWKMKPETIIDEYNFDDIEAYIGMIVINSDEEVELLNKELSSYFDIQRHQYGLSFDLSNKGISKGLGIKELCKSLNVDIKDTIAFGDGKNDVEMLKFVGLGIAMENGAIEAKDAAKYVTKSVLDEGINDALKHFGFIK